MYLNASLFSPFQELEWLDLSWNGIAGLESLRDLEELDLSGNQIYKFVFPKVFKGLRKLNALYLENLKNIDGSTLLESLGSFSSLKKLDSHYSNFRRGTMTAHAFASLECLSMKNCKLSGILHHQGVPNFKNLKFLFMDGAALNISFFQMITPMASLEILSLSSCGLTGTLPSQGRITELAVRESIKLETILLVNNCVWTFPIANSSSPTFDKFRYLSHIPVEIGANLSRLRSLNISRNAFNGSISPSIGDMNSLKSLDFSNNNFSGEIPKHLAMGCFSFQLLALSNNSLEESLSNCSLEGLHLGNNHFSGKDPGWLGKMAELVDFIMPSNYLEGPIPIEFCKLNFLEIWNLSENIISRLSQLRYFILAKNNLEVPAYNPLPAFAYSQIGPPSIKEETIDFTMKHNTFFYSGIILMLISEM
ncbi:hypothetical protein Patl1_14659 [Pistacia atlantica]|uniref:Uncharacterized protein n=1 Tax=Pistacia atlantica TaxID=434234 RepID=A0ACC1ASA2_9ROSI|nr:hypothetical protein Patl1_14659 [Pistacia atlantica]